MGDGYYNCGRKWDKMFFGQKELTIDDKSRLVLPSNYRKEFLNDECYVTLGLDPCIQIYTKPAFDKTVETMIALPEFSLEARKLKHVFLGNSNQVGIDGHGRILVPKYLLDKVKINKKVIMVGMFDHLEIWDYDTYKTFEKDGEDHYSDNASSLLMTK